MSILNTLRPTTFQRQVLAHIAAAQSPKIAAENISKNQNLVAAREILAKLGLITFSDRAATITDTGLRLAVEENITDESGELTDVGQQLIGQIQQPQTDPMGDEQSMDPMGGEGIPMESFALIRTLL